MSSFIGKHNVSPTQLQCRPRYDRLQRDRIYWQHLATRSAKRQEAIDGRPPTEFAYAPRPGKEVPRQPASGEPVLNGKLNTTESCTSADLSLSSALDWTALLRVKLENVDWDPCPPCLARPLEHRRTSGGNASHGTDEDQPLA